MLVYNNTFQFVRTDIYNLCLADNHNWPSKYGLRLVLILKIWFIKITKNSSGNSHSTPLATLERVNVKEI
jgi:hypothetical protein